MQGKKGEKTKCSVGLQGTERGGVGKFSKFCERGTGGRGEGGCKASRLISDFKINQEGYFLDLFILALICGTKNTKGLPRVEVLENKIKKLRQFVSIKDYFIGRFIKQ